METLWILTCLIEDQSDTYMPSQSQSPKCLIDDPLDMLDQVSCSSMDYWSGISVSDQSGMVSDQKCRSPIDLRWVSGKIMVSWSPPSNFIKIQRFEELFFFLYNKFLILWFFSFISTNECTYKKKMLIQFLARQIFMFFSVIF